MLHPTPSARWWRATAAVAVATGLVVVACESPTPFEAETETGVVATYEASEVPMSTLRLQEVAGTLQEKKEFEASLLPLKRTPGEPGGDAKVIRQIGELAPLRLDRAALAEIERRAAGDAGEYRYRATQTDRSAPGTITPKKWTHELREMP